MSKIFINYRRGDSIATAGRLHDRLAAAFGKNNLFLDVDHIPAGVDFVTHLNSKVTSCDVFLALIGQNWLNARDENGQQRLFDPNDFVRIEIAAALSRNVPVIPVLIDGAAIPGEGELPDDIKQLTRRNAVEIRNSQFGSDADRLVEKLQAIIKPDLTSRIRKPFLLAAATLLLVLTVWIVQDRILTPTSNAELSSSVIAAPTPSTAPSVTKLKIPTVMEYCDQIKKVIASTDTKFEAVLGRKFGDNRIARVPLTSWENCLVYMDGRFTDSRRYNCNFPGFADVTSTEKAADDVVTELKEICLTDAWSVTHKLDADGQRQSRLVGENSNATVTLRPSRDPAALTWRLEINVE